MVIPDGGSDSVLVSRQGSRVLEVRDSSHFLVRVRLPGFGGKPCYLSMCSLRLSPRPFHGKNVHGVVV